MYLEAVMTDELKHCSTDDETKIVGSLSATKIMSVYNSWQTFITLCYTYCQDIYYLLEATTYFNEHMQTCSYACTYFIVRNKILQRVWSNFG